MKIPYNPILRITGEAYVEWKILFQILHCLVYLTVFKAV